jgi:hypothetical protein
MRPVHSDSYRCLTLSSMISHCFLSRNHTTVICESRSSLFLRMFQYRMSSSFPVSGSSVRAKWASPPRECICWLYSSGVETSSADTGSHFDCPSSSTYHGAAAETGASSATASSDTLVARENLKGPEISFMRHAIMGCSKPGLRLNLSLRNITTICLSAWARNSKSER